jgi:1,2-diacylglycerol 3-beta-glucosyltransferase
LKHEETITNNLDLTLRLHFSGWSIELLKFTAVMEEGVERAIALWHQRNRWAEGGYQRYLDYWRLIAQNRLSPSKTLDLAAFWVIQYGLPTVAFPTLSWPSGAIACPSFCRCGPGPPSRWWACTRACVAPNPIPIWVHGLQTLWGNLYMLHWVLVISTMTLRLAVRPKRLRWVKTTHLGGEDDLQVHTPLTSPGLAHLPPCRAHARMTRAVMASAKAQVSPISHGRTA